MKKDYLVSVLMPAYNAEKYIEQAIKSVLEQSYSNIELVVVNDGSTDRTEEILNAYKLRGVRVIDQPNKGQCAAANRAFKESCGDYIKFFDADDLLSIDFIKNQVDRLDGRDNAIASAGWGRFYNDDLDTFKLNYENVWKDMKPIDWLVASLKNGPNMMQCGLWLIPRRVLNKSGLWHEQLTLINDFDFIIRVLLAAEKVLFTEQTTLYYRSGVSSSLSGQKSAKAYESAFLSTELGVKSILAFENSERTRKVCADAFQSWKYQFYPNMKALYQKSEAWIKQLEGSDFPFPAGGTTKRLIDLFGWKAIKKFKYFLNR